MHSSPEALKEDTYEEQEMMEQNSTFVIIQTKRIATKEPDFEQSTDK